MVGHTRRALEINSKQTRTPFLFRDTMLKLIHSDNLEYKKLTKAA
jgi:hypothetical protein